MSQKNISFTSRSIFVVPSFLLIVLLVSACGNKPPVETAPVIRPVKSMVLGPPSTTKEHVFQGKVRASDKVNLAFRVSGPLVELLVKEGDEVKQGDLLAKIDPRDFQTRLDNITGALDEAKAQLTALQKGERDEVIRSLQAKVKATRSTRDEAQKQYDRRKKLLADGMVTQSDYDQFKRALDVASAEFTKAEEDLRAASTGARQEDIQAQQSRIKSIIAQKKDAEDQLKDVKLFAPFSGTIVKTYVENFQNVQAKQEIVSLQNIRSVEIVVDIPESIVGQHTEDDILSISASFTAIPDLVITQGIEINERSKEADPLSQTYRGTLLVPQTKDQKILPGMSAEVKIALQNKKNSHYKIPLEAVFSNAQKQSCIWWIDPQTMRVQEKAIQIGEMESDGIWVLNGLEEGDQIVTAGVQQLSSGQAVRLWKPGTGEVK